MQMESFLPFAGPLLGPTAKPDQVAVRCDLPENVRTVMFKTWDPQLDAPSPIDDLRLGHRGGARLGVYWSNVWSQRFQE
jgi:hypothetical protein